MKTPSLLLLLSFATATACASSDRELSSAAREQAQARPNIILISADDLGWGELGCYGQEWIKTPAVDRLAREGMRFLDFYSGAPVCAPARAMLMTGKHSGQSFVRDNGNPGERGKPRPEELHFPGQFPLPDAEVTLAEALQSEGYTTAGYGKWGLGFEESSGDPLLQGFDHFGGYLCQVHAHNHHPRFLWLDGEKQMLEGNERGATGAVHSQDWFVDRALEFVRDQDESDDPFFLYLPFAVPHLAIQANQDIVDEYAALIPEEDHKHRGYIKHPTPRAGYAAMITQMDRGIGALMELLEELNLADDTIVIFTSDNGPTYDRLGGSDSVFFESAGPFRGYKGDVLEGGIRVPLVVRWPGRIAADSTSNLPSAWWDLFPTLADLAGAQTPEACNGISFAPTLLA
ncbi:MAG: arylsulfatase A, partial [Planctomycetota bacterium]